MLFQHPHWFSLSKKSVSCFFECVFVAYPGGESLVRFCFSKILGLDLYTPQGAGEHQDDIIYIYMFSS